MNILSLGDLLLDVIVRYDPQSGEADVGGEGVRIEPGGSAANFAVQAARLGASVRFASRVGRDWAGDMLVRSLQKEGIEAAVGYDEGEPSGRVLVMVDPGGGRRMWSYPGASSHLSPHDLDPAWFRDLDALHLTGYSLLREGPRTAALHAIRLAQANPRTLVTLDPNPPHLIAEYGPARFRELIAGLGFGIIFPNLEEGRLLTEKDAPGEIAESLLEVAPVVALTLGGDGCLVADGTHRYRLEAWPTGGVVDATGAGDAFAAAFVVEYLGSRDIAVAGAAANELAASVVGRVGGR